MPKNFDYDKVCEDLRNMGVKDFDFTKTGKFKKAAYCVLGATVFFKVNSCFLVPDEKTNAFIAYDDIVDFCKERKVKYDDLANTGDGVELMCFDMMDFDYDDCETPEDCADQPVIDDGIKAYDEIFDDDEVNRIRDIMGYIMYTFTEIQTM